MNFLWSFLAVSRWKARMHPFYLAPCPCRAVRWWLKQISTKDRDTGQDRGQLLTESQCSTELWEDEWLGHHESPQRVVLQKTPQGNDTTIGGTHVIVWASKVRLSCRVLLCFCLFCLFVYLFFQDSVVVTSSLQDIEINVAACRLILTETRWDRTGRFKEKSGVSSSRKGVGRGEGGARGIRGISQSLAHHNEDGVTASTSERG